MREFRVVRLMLTSIYRIEVRRRKLSLFKGRIEWGKWKPHRVARLSEGGIYSEPNEHGTKEAATKEYQRLLNEETERIARKYDLWEPVVPF